MKNLLHYIAAGIAPYFFFAFTYWDINPANWHEEARLFCAIISMVLVWVTFAIKNNIE
jgi:hypothetical protein